MWEDRARWWGAPTIEKIPVDATIRDLNAALGFCRDLGLAGAVERSRFVQYATELPELLDALRRRARSADASKLSSSPDAIQMKYHLCLTESWEFCDLLPYLRTTDQDSVRGKLERVLQGTPLLTDETPRSNESRNILFELSLASSLWKAGFRPELGENPDLACEAAGKRLLFECKRLLSPSKVRRRIMEARDQLRRDVTTDIPGSRGVIAVSLSKILSPGNKVLVVTESNRVLNALEDQLRMLRQQVRVLDLGKLIVGIIFNIIIPVIDDEADRFSIGHHTQTATFAREGSLDNESFRTLVEGLARIPN